MTSILSADKIISDSMSPELNKHFPSSPTCRNALALKQMFHFGLRTPEAEVALLTHAPPCRTMTLRTRPGMCDLHGFVLLPVFMCPALHLCRVCGIGRSVRTLCEEEAWTPASSVTPAVTGLLLPVLHNIQQITGKQTTRVTSEVTIKAGRLTLSVSTFILYCDF